MSKQICASCQSKSRPLAGLGVWVTLIGRKIPYGLCQKCLNEMEQGQQEKQRLLALIEKNLSPVLIGSQN